MIRVAVIGWEKLGLQTSFDHGTDFNTPNGETGTIRIAQIQLFIHLVYEKH